MNIGARALAGRPQVWAVGGGKGGTGKSLVAASLGIHLAQMGRRVIPADVVLLDLGAGTSLNVLDLFSLADRALLVILPEPTSVENCYRFLKAAFLRRLYHLGRTLGHQPIIDLVMEHRDQADDGRPYEIIEEIARVDSCVAATLTSHVEAFVPHLVMNQ